MEKKKWSSFAGSRSRPYVTLAASGERESEDSAEGGRETSPLAGGRSRAVTCTGGGAGCTESGTCILLGFGARRDQG
jgi:hypothetical protein